MAKRKTDEERTLPSVSLALGYIAVKEEQRTEDKVKVLERLGYGTKEIAAICGKTYERIRQIQEETRTRKGAKKKK